MQSNGPVFLAAGEFPEGFIYRPEFISPAAEREIVEVIQKLDFGAVVMHGVTAKRRVAQFGWLYGFDSWRTITPGPPLPEALMPLRGQAADIIGLAPDELGETLVTEYPPGAGIGWHRDAPMFGVVVAVSLLGSCRLRFQRGKGADRETRALEVEPRSVYVLSGSARSDWQHSIPSTKALRYSITFRTLRKPKA